MERLKPLEYRECVCVLMIFCMSFVFDNKTLLPFLRIFFNEEMNSELAVVVVVHQTKGWWRDENQSL